MWIRIITFALLLVVLGPPSLRAQPDRDGPRQYVPFDIDPSYQSLLKNRMELEKRLSSLKSLVKQISDDPEKFQLDPKLLKQLKLDDPKTQQMMKDWARQNPEMKNSLEDWLKRNPLNAQPPETKDLQKTLKSILDQPLPKEPTPKIVSDPPLPTIPPPPVRPLPAPKRVELPKPKVDQLAKMTERAMKNAEHSKLGDWLRDSPAWRNALADMQKSVDTPRTSLWDLDSFNKKLGLSSEKAWKIGEGWFDRLSKVPTPKMEGWRPDVKLPNLGQMPAPNINAPQLPSFGTPSLPTMSIGLTWLLFLILFVLVSWQLVRWSRRASRAEDMRARLGPWPIRPDAVTTRSELVQAFDYLALLTLGFDVQSWNHHAIAQSWGQKTPACSVVALALARLYENARYTDGAQALTDVERAEARQSLLRLAEAF